MNRTVGRFAPSPTGPLHVGSLVAAVGSWLFARKSGSAWLVRMEDLDTPRVRKGAADEILRALERYGLTWDGEVEYQSQRHELYSQALGELRSTGRAYDCACSRRDLQRAGSAPAPSDGLDAATVYPGTCRNGVGGRTPRAVRFRVDEGSVCFGDHIRGTICEDVSRTTGDFVILRADGIWAYQLAVVVDDAAQGVTQVVRGGDLLDSTARQIALQRALGYPTPTYAHLPLVVNPDGTKLGKRDGALPLPLLDERRIAATLRLALGIVGVPEVGPDSAAAMLREGLERFSPEGLRQRPETIPFSIDVV